MSIAAIAASLLAASGGVPVDVGRFERSEFPNAVKLERQLPHAEMTNRVEKIFADRQCKIDGQNKRQVDLTVPYAVLMGEAGDAKRVVVGEVGCAPVELLVGQVVVAQAARGDFQAKHKGGEAWYVSDLAFSFGTEPVSSETLADPDKVTCKKSEPVIGSRLRTKKMCKTSVEWQAFYADRKEMRRDMLNAGDCAGNPSCSSSQ
jgi:hypothetical protein